MKSRNRNIMTKKLLILAASLFMIMTIFQAPVHAMAENSNKEYTKGASLGLSHPMEVVDNASDENNENTRRKATVVPIKIEYV